MRKINRLLLTSTELIGSVQSVNHNEDEFNVIIRQIENFFLKEIFRVSLNLKDFPNEGFS